MPKQPSNPRSSVLGLLHPNCREQFTQLADTLEQAYNAGATRTAFKVFETFRTPQRQQMLFDLIGGSTKARAWHSAHQYGMAVDFVPVSGGTIWNWNPDNDWDFLHSEARKLGLEAPLAWDLAHVEFSQWRKMNPLYAETARLI